MTHTATAAGRTRQRQTPLAFPSRRSAPTRSAARVRETSSSRGLFNKRGPLERRGSASGPPGSGTAAPLVGIARLAAAAPLEETRNEVEYFRLPVRSVLNPVESGKVGFQWSINPYRGCEFGCHYCYARYTHGFMELDP